jgi:hypothetical protein
MVAGLAHDRHDPGPQGAPGDLGGVLEIESRAAQDLQLFPLRRDKYSAVIARTNNNILLVTLRNRER